MRVLEGFEQLKTRCPVVAEVTLVNGYSGGPIFTSAASPSPSNT